MTQNETDPGLLPPSKAQTVRKRSPSWIHFLPIINFPRYPNEQFNLISKQQLKELDLDSDSYNRILEDLEFLEDELQVYFRERDHAAKKAQNDSRLYELILMMLAVLSGIIGGIQALFLGFDMQMMAYFAYFEAVVALFVTFIVSINGRKNYGQLWYMNRSRAEFLRREFFRYLMDMEPYNVVEGYERRRLLSVTAAQINAGKFPDRKEEPNE